VAERLRSTARTLLRGEVESLPDGLAWLPAVVDELIEAAWGCKCAYERILRARGRFDVPDLCADAVVPHLGRLLAVHGYPPDAAPAAIELVLRQMETFAEEWAPDASR